MTSFFETDFDGVVWEYIIGVRGPGAVGGIDIFVLWDLDVDEPIFSRSNWQLNNSFIRISYICVTTVVSYICDKFYYEDLCLT